MINSKLVSCVSRYCLQRVIRGRINCEKRYTARRITGDERVELRSVEIADRAFVCKKIEDVANYYSIQDKDIRICEVEALGKVIEGDDKCVTDKIKIVRELTKDEMYKLANSGIKFLINFFLLF